MFNAWDWRDIGIFVGIAVIGYAIMSVVFRATRGSSALAPDRVCPNPVCGRLNPPGAQYCSRCGRELT